MDAETIKKQIYNLMCNKFCVNKELLNINNKFALLTGKIFQFDSVKMVYLLYEIEDLFKIKFDPLNLINYQFNTIGNIMRLVQQQLSNDNCSV